MSHALYRLGRYAACHPWRVIGAWLLVAVAVVAASSAFGKQLEDSFAVPGLDSQEAVELLQAAGADEAGITARVVMTPPDGASFFDSPIAAAALAEVQAQAAALPNVIATTDPAGALGRRSRGRDAVGRRRRGPADPAVSGGRGARRR